MFHRVMTLVYKPDPLLQIGDLRKSHPTFPEIQALWLVEKSQQISISDSGPLGPNDIKNVWAYISKDVIANFNISMPISAKIIAQKTGIIVGFWNFDF